MLDNVRQDIWHYRESLNIKKCKILYLPGFHAVLVYRFGRWLQTLTGRPAGLLLYFALMPIYAFLFAAVRLCYDIRIELSSKIGAGLVIYHLGGIVLKDCTLGDNCTIYQEVKLKPDADSGCGPRIGNCVTIGPYSSIEGKYTIGSGTTIGPGTLVCKDAPERCLLLGIPARIVRRDYHQASLHTYSPREDSV